MIFLSQDDIVKCEAITVKSVLTTIRSVFECHYNGNYILPHKSVLRWGEVESENSRGRINAMPAYLGSPFQIMGMKWIGSFPQNHNISLPRASGIIVLNDINTGVPICILEASYISAMRTAATNLLAAEYLCPKSPVSLGIVGAGTQIRFNLLAFLEVYNSITSVKVFSRNQQHARDLISIFSNHNVRIDVVESVQSALLDSDIVISSTTSNEPFINNGWFKEGVTYFHFSGNECSVDAVNHFDKIFVDDWDVILHRNNLTPAIMYNNNQLSEAKIAGNLGELVGGKIAGRVGNENIMFCSIGMAIEDIAVGYTVYLEAIKKTFGVSLSLWDNLPNLFLTD